MADATLSPPSDDSGVAWLRRRLFSNWFDGIVTLLASIALAWLIYSVFSWAVLNAVWTEAEAARCKEVSGACWAVIEARGSLILFGLYPYEQHWRSGIGCLIIIATMGLSCLPAMWGIWRLLGLWLAGFGSYVILLYGGVLGLEVVTSEQWGGLALTVFIFASVFVLGMPLAVLLALARRSKLPVISWMAAIFIDTVRSLPLLTLLFAAAVVVPFVLPDWAQGSKLGRVIIAFAIFYAAYQAEIIRAGIQSIPSGQEEAAQALGMRYRSVVLDIVLPQAFRNTLPSTINQVVITFKETSIVTIIGFFEVTASASAAVGRGEWGAYYVEVYVFVALVYFIFVFGLSRYGAYLERRSRLADV
jgi:general L-amino acid transport system permease protein